MPAERERGLDDHEDRLFAAECKLQLLEGETITMVFSTEAGASLDGDVERDARSNHEWKLFNAWQNQHAAVSGIRAEDEPGWLWQLVLAADQFLVQRPLPNDPQCLSVIAGYPWFSDWGRDTMIALPGLTLSMGRPEVARKILQSFASYVDAGMLPNNFPDSAGAPEYNSVDSALWYFEAFRQYVQSTQDTTLLRELFPVLAGNGRRARPWHSLQHQSRSSRCPAFRGKPGSTTDLDGRKGWRLGGNATERQAGGDQRALDQSVGDDGGICPSAW